MPAEDPWLSQNLKQKATKGKSLVYAVLGAGNGGLAMAGHLALGGWAVRLYNRTGSHLQGVLWHGGIQLDGVVEGFGLLAKATFDLAEAVQGADVVMIVTPATAHRELAQRLAPLLEPGQLIVLNPGRTGGALEFRQILRESRPELAVVVAETQTFLYAARSSGHRATIFRIKDSVPLATLPSYWIPSALDILREAFPQFQPGTNVLVTSLENIGAVFHPALTLLNAGWIEASGGDFEYYLEGITPSIAFFLERIDQERVSIASALGVRCHSVLEWLFLSYGSTGSNLHRAIQNTTAYRGILAPASINHRYIFEDVPMSLVPLASLGAQLGVPTPTIDLVIDLASTMHGLDYRQKGRTARSLGLDGLSIKEIGDVVAGREVRSRRSSIDTVPSSVS